MCGIVGYIGKQKALPILLKGLKALEYRGYDSAGVVVLTSSGPKIKKQAGEVKILENSLLGEDWDGGLGISHTRWATHGVPSQANAHPHSDCSGNVFLVHNGIIENHKELKNYLSKKGHQFVSETDTEIVPHLIEEFLKEGKNFRAAFFNTLKMIRGSYAFAAFYAKNPNVLYAAKLSSPLVIGVGEGEHFLASDPAPLIGFTSKVIYLKDGEVAEIRKEKLAVANLEEEPLPVEIERLEWTLEQAQKGNFPHFMLKEIFEGPEVVESALRGRLKAEEGLVKLGGLESIEEKLKEIDRLLVLACGTSYYAGLVGEYIFEEIAQIPTEVHFASEFRYRNEPLSQTMASLAISQSGETADTLSALRKAKHNGLLTLGIVNVVGSSIARETDAGVYNHAGPEIGVASTKVFLSQLAILMLMALYLFRLKKGGFNNFHHQLMEELENISSKIKLVLKEAPLVEDLAEKYKKFNNFLFLGRRYNYPIALEGALKLKEITYVHAEGYGAGEMKHGPLAMIGPDFPTVAIVPQNSVSQKMYSNIEEIKAREGPVLAIATEGDLKIKSLADEVFYIPPTLEPLEPMIAVLPLQLFAYYLGVKRGYNVDKPRNLAKSVTVE